MYTENNTTFLQFTIGNAEAAAKIPASVFQYVLAYVASAAGPEVSMDLAAMAYEHSVVTIGLDSERVADATEVASTQQLPEGVLPICMWYSGDSMGCSQYGYLDPSTSTMLWSAI